MQYIFFFAHHARYRQKQRDSTDFFVVFGVQIGEKLTNKCVLTYSGRNLYPDLRFKGSLVLK